MGCHHGTEQEASGRALRVVRRPPALSDPSFGGSGSAACPVGFELGTPIGVVAPFFKNVARLLTVSSRREQAVGTDLCRTGN